MRFIGVISYNKCMIKKLIWLAVFVGIGYGVYSIGPWVYQKYTAYLAGETAKMAVQVNTTAEDLASPATSAAGHQVQNTQRKLDAMDRGRDPQGTEP